MATGAEQEDPGLLQVDMLAAREGSGEPDAKCRTCRQDRKKCVRSGGNTKCDRCLQMHYVCDLDETSGPDQPRRRKLNYLKCSSCRKTKQKCLPTDRVWPQKCHRCIERKLPCSPPEGPKGRELKSVAINLNKAIESSPECASSRSTLPSLANIAHSIPTIIYPTTPQPSLGSLTDSEATYKDYWEQYRFAPMRLGPSDIRLIRLLPGQFDDPIECVAFHARKESRYEALSYFWGTDQPSSTITVQENGRRYRYSVRRNLNAALRHLRDPKVDRVLWVDCLSINQDDPVEKSHFVAKMADIYSTASHVCVWLGEQTEDSPAAFQFIRDCIIDLSASDRFIREHNRGTKETPNEWTAVHNLFRRPWFSRLWVVQEIAMAAQATIYCGHDTVQWTEFADAMAVFEATETRPGIPSNLPAGGLANDSQRFQAAGHLLNVLPRLVRKFDDGRIAERLLSLESLVSLLSMNFECSDPRDIVYAVLGLARDAWAIADVKYSTRYPTGYGEEHLHKTTPTRSWASVTMEPTFTQPPEMRLSDSQLKKIRSVIRVWQERLSARKFVVDYSESFFSVCKDFISFAVKKSSSLDIICRPWAQKHDTIFPSWVRTRSDAPFGPGIDDRPRRINADPLVGTNKYGVRSYNASGSTEAIICKFQMEDVQYCSLYAQGFVLDTIVEKGDQALGGIIPSDWLEIAASTSQNHGPPEDCWRILVGDRDAEGRKPPAYYKRAFQYALRQTVSGGDLTTPELINSSDSMLVKEFLLRVQSVVWSRRMIRTKSNLLGLAPKKLKKQDIICILYGCSVPVVLRPIPKIDTPSQYYYELIGECYIHGMMDGEAMNARRRPIETFEIR